MEHTARSQLLTALAAILGGIYIAFAQNSFAAVVTFTLVCIALAAWYFFKVFRGRDEVVSAHARYALAFAGGIGVPLLVATAMLVIAVPAVQGLVTDLAAATRHEISPAAAGFVAGMGFAAVMLNAVFCVGLTIWWASKR